MQNLTQGWKQQGIFFKVSTLPQREASPPLSPTVADLCSISLVNYIVHRKRISEAVSVTISVNFFSYACNSPEHR